MFANSNQIILRVIFNNQLNVKVISINISYNNWNNYENFNQIKNYLNNFFSVNYSV